MYANPQSLRMVLLVVSLTTLAALSLYPSPTMAQAKGGSPLRLRLSVAKNTLRPGDATKLFIDFLDSNYRPVPNDRTRMIVFGTAATTSQNVAPGRGEIAPQRVSVGPGPWSASVFFSAKQAGRVYLTASSEELDPARALILITAPRASFIKSLEPVAHAQSDAELNLERTDLLGTTPTGAQPVPANNTSAAELTISFPPNENERRTLKITTNPQVRLLHWRVNETGVRTMKEKVGSIAISVEKDIGVVEGLNVFSSKEGPVTISAELFPTVLSGQLTVQFESPRPTCVMIYEAPPTITPGTSMVLVRIGLGDQTKVRLKPVESCQIGLSFPNDANFVRLSPENPPPILSATHPSVVQSFQLAAFPPRGKIELLAQDRDGNLSAETRTFPVDSEIKKIIVSGPPAVSADGKELEFTIRLADKDDRPQVADWERTIDLSVDDGELASRQVKISSGQAYGSVRWRPRGSKEQAVVAAESFPLDPGQYQVRLLFIPTYKLVLMALVGGVIGGLARQLHKGGRLERIRPRWTGRDWDLGLVGRISGSVVSGLFLYWTMKFGLARVEMDLGTMPVATFFGGIGGFAGLVVLDRLVEWVFKLLHWSAPEKKHHSATA